MKSDQVYDVVVVGAGMAGLTGAAYLGRSGYRVLVCEQGEKAGGLVGSFDHLGFRFDAGIRAFENSGIIFPMLKDLGIQIEFIRNPVSIGIEDQVIKLASKQSLADYQDLLCRLFPQSTAEIPQIISEIRKVMQYMDVLYGIDNPLFLDYTKDKHYLIHTLLPWLIKYQINIRKARKLNEPINRYLGHFTRNQALIDMIAQHFFRNTPTFFALSYFGLYLDYSYPAGGTGVLVDKIVRYIREHRGEIAFRAKICSIDVDSQQVVTADGRSYGYKKLIWAGDMKSLYACADYRKRAGQKRSSAILAQGERVKKARGGDSILTFYLAVDLNAGYFAGTCGAHCFYTPSKAGLSDMNIDGWQSIVSAPANTDADVKARLKNWVATYLDLTTYEISCPAVRDSSLAPDGKTGVIVSTLMSYPLVKHIHDAGWYQEYKDFCGQHALGVLSKTLFPAMWGKVDAVLCSTPLTIEKLTGNSEGAITGWAFEGNKMPVENQFQKIARSINTPIANVYQAGQWAFSPSGLPVSILTGKLAADAIHKALGSPATKESGKKSWT